MKTERYQIVRDCVRSEKVADFSTAQFREQNPDIVKLISDKTVNGTEPVSLVWDKHKTNPKLNINCYRNFDFDEYNTIRLTLYSNQAKHSLVKVYLHGINVKEQDRTLSVDININFEGWKTIDIELRDFWNRQQPKLKNIDRLGFSCGEPLRGFEDDVLAVAAIELVEARLRIEPELTPDDTAEALGRLKKRWREYIAGREGGYDTSIPEYVKRLNDINEKCERFWNMFRDTYTGERGSAFGYDIAEGVRGDEIKVDKMYSHILSMTRGYATYGTKFYKNGELLADIKKALDYGYKYYYGRNIEERWYWGNWWHWYIGIQIHLVDTLMMLYDELSAEDIKRYFEPFDYLQYYPGMSACNKAWCTNGCFASAILQNDAERLLLSVEKATDLFEFVRCCDGSYTDGSFIQHWYHPYTNGYGRGLFGYTAKLRYIVAGSEFDFSGDVISNQYKWAFENMRWGICNGNGLAALAGRNIQRTGWSERDGVGAPGFVSVLVNIAHCSQGELREKVESEIRYFMKLLNKDFTSVVAFPFIQYVKELYSNESIKPAEPIEALQVFGAMDRVVRHGKNFGACVANSSTRIYKFEAINFENMNAWYIGDGMLYVYTDEYEYDAVYFTKKNPYRCPGVTADTGKREERNLQQWREPHYFPVFGGKPMAGGASGGKYGLSCYELGYPEKNDSYITDITARKTNFFFDEEIVCVGSGIKDSSENEVETVLDNRTWREGDVFTVDGEVKELTPVIAGEDNSPAANYHTDTEDFATVLHFTNMGGYVFFEPTPVRYRKYENEKSFLELVTPHGKKPNGAKYAYILTPAMTAEQTAVYSKRTDVKVHCITDTAHVVSKASLGCVGYAFYEAGEACGIKTDVPAAVFVTHENGKIKITATDPQQLYKEVNLTVELAELTRLLGIDAQAQKLAVACADNRTEAAVKDGILTVKLNTFEELGEAHRIELC